MSQRLGRYPVRAQRCANRIARSQLGTEPRLGPLGVLHRVEAATLTLALDLDLDVPAAR